MNSKEQLIENIKDKESKTSEYIRRHNEKVKEPNNGKSLAEYSVEHYKTNGVYLAYHKEYKKPLSDNLVPCDVSNYALDHKYYSELSMVDNLLQDNNLLPDELGVGHYRRFMQSDSFIKTSESIPPFVFGREYNKDSRPTLPLNDEYYSMVTKDYIITLGDYDVLVLEPFVKSSKKGLYSLVDIGWLNRDMVNNFFIFLRSYLPKHEYKHIYELNNNNTIHYCNNIMYSDKYIFVEYWSNVMDILKEFEIFMSNNKKKKSQLTPRCFGYLGEYLMRPIMEIQGLSVGHRKSICFEQ